MSLQTAGRSREIQDFAMLVGETSGGTSADQPVELCRGGYDYGKPETEVEEG
jgi:hypothetical protein